MGKKALDKAPTTLLSSRFQIVILRYFILLIPVVLLTLGIQLNQDSIENHFLGHTNYLNFLLFSGLITPCLAQFVLFSQLNAKKEEGDFVSIKKQLLTSFFKTFPSLFAASFILSVLLVIVLQKPIALSLEASLAMIYLLTTNCLFVCFISITDRVKNRKAWVVTWSVYIGLFLLFPLNWWLPASAASLLCFLMTWETRYPLGEINVLSTLSLSGFKGLFLASIIWLDKIILFLFAPEAFKPEYIFISLIPCILTLNYYYVYIQRKLGEAINTLIWGVSNYSILHYIKLNQSAVITLKRSLILVTGFALITNIFVFFIGSNLLEDNGRLALNLAIGLAVTLMAILLNIHLFFSSRFIFFIASIFFLAAVNILTVFEGLSSHVKTVVALVMMVLAFQLLASDLLKRWKAPHRDLLELK